MTGKLDMGHARALLGLSGAQQVSAAGKVVAEQLSVRDTERLVRSMSSPPARRTARGNGNRDADVVRLQDDLAEALGAQVRIDAGKRRRPRGHRVLEPRAARRHLVRLRRK